jgi:hypothetical protein
MNFVIAESDKNRLCNNGSSRYLISHIKILAYSLLILKLKAKTAVIPWTTL